MVRVANLVVVVVCLATLASEARAFQIETRVFERLQLGQSIDDVRKTYPTVRQLDHEQLGATVVYSPFITRYQIPATPVAGLAHPISFELRFWKGQLWVVIGYFGDNTADDISKLFASRYGSSKSPRPDPAKIGKTATVTMNAKQKWFSVNDPVISAEVSRLLMESLGQQRPAQSVTAPKSVPASPQAPQVTPSR